MRIIIIEIFLLFSFAICTYSQSLTKQEAESFIKALLTNSDDLKKYFDDSEVRFSKRLGISYSDIKFKLLISIDIDPIIKAQILDQQLKYEYEIDSLKTDFSKLIVKIPERNLKYEFVFHNSKMISESGYYSQNWASFNSKYFVFHASDSSLLNEYSINRLDSFVENMLELLKCSDEEIRKLKDEKIHYFLCQDDSEIVNLTGYSARGLYYIANDFIISIFNCHYHEIAHLLINYKLKSLSLFTQPLFQEGFAVAYSGRGGKEPNVILDMGLFLVKSNFLDYKMLLSKAAFYQYDASMSYPVAGLYVKFLIEFFGIEKYLELYTKYSSSSDEIDKIQISPDDLPASIVWENFFNKNTDSNLIRISNIDAKNFQFLVSENEDVSIYANDNEYLIKVKNNVGLKSKENINYHSTLFSELFPNSKYQGEKYIISANAEEVSIYNLFTNNLIAKYVKGFSIDNESVQQENGYFVFSVKRKIFDDNLECMIFVKCGT